MSKIPDMWRTIPSGLRARLLAIGSCAVTLLAGGAGLLPATASAKASSPRNISFQPFFEYTVSFVGSGSYSVKEVAEGANTLTASASFKWKTVYPNVLVPTTSSSPLEASGFPAYGLGQDGSGTWKISNEGSEDEDCSQAGDLGLPSGMGGSGGGGAVKVHRSGIGAGKGVVFELVALSEYETTSGALSGPLPCETTSFWHDWVTSFTGVGFKHVHEGLKDVQPLSAKVKLAPSELKHGTVTKHVSIGEAEEVPSDCGSGGGETCTQSYTWSGSIRFTKHKFKTAKHG
jgi:hypothetical protein